VYKAKFLKEKRHEQRKLLYQQPGDGRLTNNALLYVRKIPAYDDEDSGI
jgi:hypothetical protein